MAKKKDDSGTRLIEEWDPNSKEPWLLEFEKQPVNDERWSCLVTSAIPAKVEDEECIEIYKKCVASGLRRAVKVISMSDVVSFLKENSNSSIKLGEKKQKGEKPEKTDKKEEKVLSSPFARILNLILKYATFSEFDCKLPPGLMAVLLKYMILKLKEDNIREKKINAVRRRKIRERNLKAKFIRDLRPYEINEEVEGEYPGTPEQNEQKEHEDDEPFDGPDLYILLTEFFDVLYYPELLKINLPFLAFLKISCAKDMMYKNMSSSSIPDQNGNKGVAIDEFWTNLEESSSNLEKTSSFKDIALVTYTPGSFLKYLDLNHYNDDVIFDELFWTQHAVYRIYCQHQKYLQEVYIQNVIGSLETLDLSKCELYNKLCDALITGQPLTPLFVLYAMIEQLVVGVPETESTVVEFERNLFDFFPSESRSITDDGSGTENSTVNLVTPCIQCRDKVDGIVNVCHASLDDSRSTGKSEWTSNFDDKAAKESTYQSIASFTKSISNHSNQSDCSEESKISMALIDQVLCERKTEKELRKERKWKTPSICFFGDSVTLDTYHCDPRIIDPDELVNRFMKNSNLIDVWTKYPELPPEERAFYNFHYDSFLKISHEQEDLFRIKILFTLLMKITGISKSYVFKGDEETLSSKSHGSLKGNDKYASMANFPALLETSGNSHNLSSYYLGAFVYKNAQNKAISTFLNLKMPDSGKRQSVVYGNLNLARNLNYTTHKSNDVQNPESKSQKLFFDYKYELLLPVLECLDISSISDFGFIKQEEELPKIIDSFSYYEKLKPNLMIQRLLEYRKCYNTMYCTYFPPLDNLAVLMYNDSDHRGIFYQMNNGRLPTPVAFRDFYSYVYKEINAWVIEEIAQNMTFVLKFMEKEKAMQEKKDEEFLAKLKMFYCGLNEEGRERFREQEIDDTSEPEVKENELRNLPYKIKPESSDKVSFVVSGFGDLRVQVNQKAYKFYSKDGTEVHVVSNIWLYDPSEILTLMIRQQTLWFRYCVCLGDEETNLTFTLKTASDIIFVFFKEPETSTEEQTQFNVRMSWPTGLLIEVKSTSDPPYENRYIKQSYLKIYRKGWEIEDEKSRCYMKSGEILIFKETGEIKILTGSGTMHNLYYGELSRCETLTMTGGVWEQRIGKTRCRKKKKISTLKIYIGVDGKTQETYYRRDDGTFCMLWPSGKLVTNYPDGTKITSIPEFDEVGVEIKWSEEDSEFIQEVESMHAEDFVQNSLTGMRNGDSINVSQGCIQSEEFISVSCTYLMEHPKYSTVYCEPKTSFIEIRMPENVGIKMYPEGCFEVQKEDKFLLVKDNIAQFKKQCENCGESSTATINFDSDMLCQFVDFFGNEFLVFKNGGTVFQENLTLHDDLGEDGNEGENKSTDLPCCNQHAANISQKQRCLVLERDLSGIEFIHEDDLARHCHNLQNDTYFDLNTDDPNAISHTFSSSLSKVGYENWVMNYEKDDSLPTNLKKKDLKDLDIKDNRNKLFKYPFPRSHDFEKNQNNHHSRQKIKMPKVKLVRIIKSLPLPGPKKVIKDVKSYTELYQKRALDIWQRYKKHREDETSCDDPKGVNLRLKRIAVTLSQSLTLYPHVCTQLPSTEIDIHYFGHLINSMEDLKCHFHGKSYLLPTCKQIPRRLPQLSGFPTIPEECESCNV